MYFFFVLARMKALGLFLVLTITSISGVDRNNFKTCDQSGFCKRLRPFKPEKSQYSLNLDTVVVHGNVLSAEVVTVDTEAEKRTILVSCSNYNYLFNIYHERKYTFWTSAKIHVIF